MVNSAAASPRSPTGHRVPDAVDDSQRYTRQPLPLLDYRWSKRQAGHHHSGLQQLLDPAHTLSEMPLTYQGVLPRPADLPALTGLYTQHTTPTDTLTNVTDAPLEPTLEDSVIEGLIRALYAALPDALSQTEAEVTASGNKVGRHGYAPKTTPENHWQPFSVPQRTEAHDKQPEERVSEQPEAAPEPEPRPYVLGTMPDGLQLITLRSLAALDVAPPTDQTTALLSAQHVLGAGEPCFLRAQSALWSWRTHRQTNMDIHAHGPPLPGRNALIEQKIGPVTLLLGCRVTDLTDEPRRWGFTLVSLNGQVLVCRETFMVEWQADDTVTFHISTQQQLAMPALTFLGPVHSALRRKFKQGYIRNMVELTSD